MQGSYFPAESGWALLPNGNILSVGAYYSYVADICNTATGVWTRTPSSMVDLHSGANEQGPIVLRPDGTVVAFGALGNNSIYNIKYGNWSAGPSIVSPLGYPCTLADAPGTSVVLV